MHRGQYPSGTTDIHRGIEGRLFEALMPAATFALACEHNKLFSVDRRACLSLELQRGAPAPHQQVVDDYDEREHQEEVDEIANTRDEKAQRPQYDEYDDQGPEHCGASRRVAPARSALHKAE